MTKKPVSTKGGFLNVLILLLVGATAFFGSVFYLARIKSVKLYLAVENASQQGIVAYRLSSGLLDKYLGDDEDSATVVLPLRDRCAFYDDKGKKTSPELLFSSPGSKKYCEVVIGPDEKVWSFKDAGDLQECFEEVLGVEGGIMETGDGDFYIRDAFFVSDEPDFSPLIGDKIGFLAHKGEALVLWLEQGAGVLEVSAQDGSGIYVDGIFRGNAPDRFRVSPGERQVTAKKTGYADKSEYVQVVADQVSQITLELSEVTTLLHVDSSPSGAQIVVDGEEKGFSPISLDLSPGKHTVRFFLSGYKTEKRDVVLRAKAEKRLFAELVSDRSAPKGGQGDYKLVRVDGFGRTVRVSDASGREFTLPLSEKVRLDGWQISASALSRLRPGEELKISFDSEGLPSELNTTYSHSFSLGGVVMGISDGEIFLGDNWRRCLFGKSVIAEDKGGSIQVSQISTGDTVTLYGASQDDIRYVLRADTLGKKEQLEGFLVRSGQSFKLFKDDGAIDIAVPGDVLAADLGAKVSLPLKDVAQGSRVLLFKNGEGAVIWADVISGAQNLLEGRINHMEAASIFVGPSWGSATIGMGTKVFLGEKQASFYDLRLGDLVLAGGPLTGDLEFIWVKERPEIKKEVLAVVVTPVTGWDLGKTAYQLNSDMTKAILPISLNENQTYGCPELEKEIPVKDLFPGDRLKVFLGSDGKALWGQVISKQDDYFEGRYLGTLRQNYYFSGFLNYAKAPGFLSVGLLENQDLFPGAKVIGSEKDGFLTFLEVRENLRPQSPRDAVFLTVSDDALILKRGNGCTGYEYDEDGVFVDWQGRLDGDLAGLLPGDEITYSTVSGKIYFAERTYSHPFKAAGTILRTQDRNAVLVIGSGDTTQTLALSKNPVVYKNGSLISPRFLEIGDEIRALGDGYDYIEVVVVEN